MGSRLALGFDFDLYPPSQIPGKIQSLTLSRLNAGVRHPTLFRCGHWPTDSDSGKWTIGSHPSAHIEIMKWKKVRIK